MPAGRKTYYESGVLMNETPYVNGQREGVQKSYYENGALKCETPFKEGKADGVQQCYSASGKPGVILQNVLSGEGTIAEISLNLDVYQKTEFSDGDRKYFNERSKDAAFSIEMADIAPLTVDFSDSERQRVITVFEKLGEQGKINMFILPLYRKFKV